MDFDIRTPTLTAKDADGQIRQLSSYMFQLAGQLKYALGTIDGNVETAMQAASNAAARAASVEKSTSPGNTFTSIKSLIIKSADIVDAYYEQINRKLSSQYIAQSEYGTFTQYTDQKIQETSDGILREFQDVQTIVTELQTSVLDVTAYVRTGKLYDADDGTPVYGVEIGQQVAKDGQNTFRKYTRLAANKLSFYDQNDNEVAYLSDRVLHITEANVTTLDARTIRTEQITMGDFVITSGTGRLTIQ